MKNRGETVNRAELERIAKYARIGSHAIDRINERRRGLDFRKAIAESFLAFYNTDGALNVAIDEFSYFVLTIDRKDPNRFYICTFIVKDTGITVYDKWEYAKRGYKKINR